MRYRLGMIGGGMYGAVLADVFDSLSKAGNIDFCALCDISETVREDMRQRYGVAVYRDYREMIDQANLQAVAVVTPDFLHEEMAVYAATRGLHLMVQKPLDTTTAGARRIVAAAKEHGMMLYVDFHKRFDPSFRLLRNNYRQGRMGELLYGYANIEDTLAIPSVSFKSWAHCSSPAWFIGVHLCDMINWVFGKPESVFATGQKKKLVSMGIDTYDSIQTKMIYESGASITLDASWVLPMNFPSIVNQNMRIVGTEGIMEIDGQHRGIEAWMSDGGAAVPNPYGYLANRNPVSGCSLEGYTIQSPEYFVRLLGLLADGMPLAELPEYPGGEEAVAATRVVEAIHESLAEGCVVRV